MSTLEWDKPLQTRDGHSVRIFADTMHEDYFSVVGVVLGRPGTRLESLYSVE